MGPEASSKFPKVTALIRSKLKTLHRFVWIKAPCSYLLHKTMQMPSKNTLSYVTGGISVSFVSVKCKTLC